MKGHPTSQGWTTLHTVRGSGLTRMACARYSDRQIVLSFWKYDTAKRESGDASVDWEMTHEIMLPHHAVAKIISVYMDGMINGMREQIGALLPEETP